MTSPPSLRVLVVDDSALYRQMLKHVVGGVAGVEVVGTAVDGLEAVNKIADLRPDLVTLDVQMPNLDGLGVLREIKRRSLQTLVVMVSSLTAQGAPETVEVCCTGRSTVCSSRPGWSRISPGQNFVRRWVNGLPPCWRPVAKLR